MLQYRTSHFRTTKKSHLIIFIFLSVVFTGCMVNVDSAFIVSGEMDARFLEWSSIQQLDGEWYFAEGLREPDDINLDHFTIVEVPGPWNSYPILETGERMGFSGAGTFVLDVYHMPEQQLAVYCRNMGTAYNIFIQTLPDGEVSEIISNGVVSEDVSDHVPHFLPGYRVFSPPERGRMRIIVWISNNSSWTGGMWNPLLVGAPELIRSMQRNTIMLSVFNVGIVLYMSLYYFLYFILRRKEPANLFFSLFCLFLGLRVLAADRILAFLFGSVPSHFFFEMVANIEFGMNYLMGATFYYFFYYNYPDEMRKSPGYVLAAVSAACFIITLSTPLRIHAHLMRFYQYFLVATLFYCLLVLVKAMLRERPGANLSIWGFMLFFGAVVNDILVSNEVLQTPFLLGYGFLAFIISQSIQMIIKHTRALTNLEILNESMYRFVPHQFIENLGKRTILDVTLGDAIEKQMSVMFVDIRAFTSLSEKMTPQENFKFLNSYLSRISPIIRSHNGFIDKYVGDGFMALFTRSADAVATAMDISEALKVYNTHRRNSGYEGISIGISIHVGSIMLGTIGEERRIDGTVIADTVNVASRLEGMNKVFGSMIISSEEIVEYTKNDVECDFRLLGEVQVRGREAALRIYEMVMKDSKKLITKEMFEKAVKYFIRNEYEKAGALFADICMNDPEDKAAAYYQKMCKNKIS
ncbi:MAG: adenylate/guanylate cyclase domain-containing protein [Spirochaetia bacterium]